MSTQTDEITARFAARDAAYEAVEAAFADLHAQLKRRLPPTGPVRFRAGPEWSAAMERLLAAKSAAFDALDEMQRAADGRPTKADEEAARDAASEEMYRDPANW